MACEVQQYPDTPASCEWRMSKLLAVLADLEHQSILAANTISSISALPPRAPYFPLVSGPCASENDGEHLLVPFRRGTKHGFFHSTSNTRIPLVIYLLAASELGFDAMIPHTILLSIRPYSESCEHCTFGFGMENPSSPNAQVCLNTSHYTMSRSAVLRVMAREYASHARTLGISAAHEARLHVLAATIGHGVSEEDGHRELCDIVPRLDMSAVLARRVITRERAPRQITIASSSSASSASTQRRRATASRARRARRAAWEQDSDESDVAEDSDEDEATQREMEAEWAAAGSDNDEENGTARQRKRKSTQRTTSAATRTRTRRPRRDSNSNGSAQRSMEEPTVPDDVSTSAMIHGDPTLTDDITTIALPEVQTTFFPSLVHSPPRPQHAHTLLAAPPTANTPPTFSFQYQPSTSTQEHTLPLVNGSLSSLFSLDLPNGPASAPFNSLLDSMSEDEISQVLNTSV